MEGVQRMDLTYITERIITISCPAVCPEQIYLQSLRDIVLMLQSKHSHNYLLINLSEKNDSLTQMNHKIMDTGWVDLLAPNLDQVLSVCATMENWLQKHPKHVLVLHCRGGQGRVGVLVASYIHRNNTSASADVSLDLFAMRRFYTDKLLPVMTPSQKQYVWMLGAVLRGGMRMSPSPCFLLCVVLHGLPRTRPDGGCCLFLKVYQRLQTVCTSAVYHVHAGHTNGLYFVLQPAQLLKDDIMVVCYDKNSRAGSRQVIFRLQFHTGIIQGHSPTFSKVDLDCANEDHRFPEDGKVQLMLSDGPEKISGRELWHNGRTVTVDYDTLEPLVRRDSFSIPYRRSPPLEAGLPRALDPGFGPVYAKVNKRSVEEGASFWPTPSSPTCSDRAPSASSDSGLSVTSQGRATASKTLSTGAERDGCAQARELVSGLDPEPARPPLEVMTDHPNSGGGEGDIAGDQRGLGHAVNGLTLSSERETDILDDEEEVHNEVSLSVLEMLNSSSICSLSSENLPEVQRSVQSQYATHSWIQQQQMADITTHTTHTTRTSRTTRTTHSGYLSVDGEESKPGPLVAPQTPPRGISSKDAVERGLTTEAGTHNTDITQSTQSTLSSLSETACQDEELDESIEQLNQLILDLDPTFIPVPTRCAPLSRSASLHSNGLSHKGRDHLSGWKKHGQVSDVTDYPCLQSPGWKGGGAKSSYSPTPSPSQRGHLHKSNSVNFRGQTPLMDTSDLVPPTPAFPVSPPTPYVKGFSEFSQLSSGTQWDQHSWTQGSRSFLDSMNHAGSSADGELFRSDVSVTPASCQRIFGSMCSVSSSSPLPHTDSSTPPPGWQDRTTNSQNSLFQPQPSPPLSLSSPNAHSSPRGGPRIQGGPGAHRETDSSDLSSLLLGNGGLEHSLLEVMEGLGDLGLGLGEGGPPPLLPEKRRTGEGGEFGSRSPSLSGFSSPRSGSSLSIPLSSCMTPDPLRGLGGAPSPGADLGSKHDNVKFVQDTSKFWYKPDISREQAIAVLKDKEPGFFIVRDSHSFRGAYGLAMKVATPPPSVVQQSKKDLSNELVRHFLIECTQKGVRLKGCPNEPYFGSLTALVCQHSITPLALPCKLILPDRDPVEELSDSSTQTATNSAAELLKQGAACNVWYLGSVELESLTGHQAVQKATTLTLAMDPPSASTVVHFKVSAQGITLTDNQRKLFFRRHYTVNTVIFCSLDPQGRKWTRGSGSTAKIFGFVARKSQSETENVCHLFAEHDPEQPASAIVNFVSKVMIGSHKK
ncbi:tensin 3-2 isoform X2 [Genypterus blacodes]|uniref:tensin 3-2 isoform X2 n=1 Tax=Genypterus blacodes TaxID=154954 RepID=UPI003F7601C0